MKKGDDEQSKNYFFFIYWNPKDKRIFVPKRSGVGWTINFANPFSILLSFIFIIIVTLILYFF